MEPDTSPEFFERLYDAGDPWHFDTDPYEQGRYDAILEALGDRRFARAYEPGCAVGALTVRLASRCDRLVARDVSATAVDRARAVCEAHPHVDVDVGAVERDRPAGQFDLVVFSELGYYFDEAELLDVLDRVVGLLAAGGVLVGTHWTGRSPDHRITGEAVVELIDSHPELHGSIAEHDGFLLGDWTRRPDGS